MAAPAPPQPNGAARGPPPAAAIQTFIPKQAFAKSPTLWAELTGQMTDRVAAHTLTLIPPIPPHSIIHDNGCGTGEATRAVLASVEPAVAKTLTIHATDVNPLMLQAASKSLNSTTYPGVAIEVTNLPAENLSAFSDDSFTHSFANMVLRSSLHDGIDFAAEIHRTLQPGGTAVATAFTFIPHRGPLREAHQKTRPGVPFPPLLVAEGWYATTDLVYSLSNGGFEKSKIQYVEWPVELGIKDGDLKRWASMNWSYLGVPVGGWKESDEANWDVAVETVLEGLRGSSSLKGTEGLGGDLRLIYTASIAVATK